MKKILSLALMVLLTACASQKNSRKLSSIEDLTGHYLGVANYKSPHKGPNKPAVRVYFHPIQGEPGKYTAIIFEYVDLLAMAPSYVVSNKLPLIAKATGFLNSIGRNTSVYEVVPGAQEGTFEMWPLTVSGDQIVVKPGSQPRILKLDLDKSSPDGKTLNTLAGATISGPNKGEPKEIFFPKKDDDKVDGIQYKTAKLAYQVAKLDSTWRKNYLRGPYLSQYAKVDDVVLNLAKSGNEDVADFVLNPKEQKTPAKKREKIFTNKKSAFLKGQFKVSEPRDGMFLFHPVDGDAKTNEILKGRIGLFIDVFDATKSLNQDVVELSIINPEDPEDFLMYYEHPDNGEGTKKEEE